MTIQTPDRLAYRASNGVVEVHLPDSVDIQRGFNRFIERVAGWMPPKSKQVLPDPTVPEAGDRAPRSAAVRLIDTFLGDSLDQEALRTIFGVSDGSDCLLLLAKPETPFALARAHSANLFLGTESQRTAETRLTVGLRNVVRALRVARPCDSWPDDVGIDKATLSHLIRILRGTQDHTRVFTRFYEASPSSPMYFFGDLVVAGRFSYGRSSVDMPWQLIVNDPSTDGDVFGFLSREFDDIWAQSSATVDTAVRPTRFPAPVGQSLWPSRNDDTYQVFLSYARDDETIASQFRKAIEGLELPGVDGRVARVSVFQDLEQITAGDKFRDRIQKALQTSHEMVVLVSAATLESQWVLAEVGAFWASTLDQPTRTISPITIGLSPDRIPELVREYQSVQFTGDDAVQSIVKAVSARAMTFYGARDEPETS